MDADRNHGQAAEEAFLTSANEEAFTAQLPPVRRLELHKGATRVKRSRERSKPDELWLGEAFDPTNPNEASITVYARLGDTGALVAELVCGCIARALGLPAPEVFIVNLPAGILPKSKIASKDSDLICVATKALGGETFSQLLNDDDDAAVQLLHQWSDLPTVAAFDEWTANTDRNMGNIIYAAKEFYIIDHADAFGGKSREIYPLEELSEVVFTNILAELLNAFDVNKRSAILKKIGNWIAETAAQVDVLMVVGNAGTHNLPHGANQQELVAFLNHRLSVTHTFLCQKLGHPQLGLPPVRH